MSIYITQLVYLEAGEERTFQQFEELAIPLIAKHNGKLLLRMRSGADTIVESNMELPYEVHFVEFAGEEDFRHFVNDETRKQFLHLKERSVKAVFMVKGEKI